MSSKKNHAEHIEGSPPELSFSKDLRRLIISFSVIFRMLSFKRRWHLILMVFVQIIASLAEAISLGAIIPFLTALSSPEILSENRFSAAIISHFRIANSEDMIIVFSIVFAIAVVFSSSARLFALRIQTRITAHASSDLVEIAYGNVMRQGYLYHLRNSASQISSTILYDFNVASSIFQQFFFISAHLVLITVILVSLLLIEPIIVVGVSAVVILNYLTVASKTREFLRRQFIEISNKNRNFMERLHTGFNAAREIILANQQQKFIDELTKIDRPMRLAQANIPFVQAIPRFTLEVVGIITFILVLTFLALNYGTFIEAVPVIGATAYATNRLAPAAHGLYTAVSAMRAAYVSLNRTIDLMTRPPESLPSSNPSQMIEIKNEIHLNGLSFSYEEGTRPDEKGEGLTINSITAKIKANKVTALVGTSGSGKTTLANIIMGLFPIESGNISIDGIKLSDRNMINWRRSISHVPQDGFILNGTIKENIVFGSDDLFIDNNHLIDCVRDAQLDQLIADSPDGLERIVGDRGSLLSGGQRQRLAIARALYNRAKLIVLDEATSALDNPTENAIIEVIKRLSGRATVIVIAHGTQMMQNADCILLLNDGEIVAEGPYNQLKKESSHFRHLIAEEAITTAQITDFKA